MAELEAKKEDIEVRLAEIDGVPFVTLAIYETEINHCPKCGLWIDPDEIRQVDRFDAARSVR
jgi:Zn-finger nucleic acid-binding protein